MNRYMYCLQKRQVIIGGFIIFLGIVLVWSKTIQESPKSYNTRAGEAPTACSKAGLYNIPVQGLSPTPGFVRNYYETFCKSNEDSPIWDGSIGSSAKCLTATLVCGSKANCNDISCIMNVSNSIKCLYKEVPIDICKSAGVVKEEQLQYVCMYAGEQVTAASTPYYYSDSSTQTLGGVAPVDTTYKCIKNNGYNVGVRCITDAAGEIIANYNMEDKVNCPLSASPVPQVTAIPLLQNTTAPVQVTDTQVTPPPPAPQPQKTNCDIKNFKDYNCGVEGWKVGDCKTDTNGISRICGCDPNNTWISYPILYEVNTCP